MTRDLKQIQETFLAKWTYEHLSLLKDQTLGPTLRMNPEYFEVYDVIQVGLEKIVGDKREAEFNRVIEVPSPWHAVLMLESLQHHLSLQKQRAIFRGQSDCTWPICSSLSRKGTDRKTENFRAKLFCDILSAMSFNTLTTYSPHSSAINLKVPSASYLAAAQHYGIKTNLIDYTPDPAVAVYFASTTSQDRSNKKASVSALLLNDAFDNGCEIIIPPPFIERLHVQRGFFIKHTDPDEIIDRDKFVIFEIQFPSDYDFQPFDVVRRGIGRVEILPENPPIEELLKVVNKVIEEHSIEIADDLYAKIVENSAYELKKYFKEIYSDLMLMWAKYIDLFEDMLYWVAYYVDETGNEELNMDTLLKIIDSNKDLILSIAQFYRWTAKHPTVDISEEKKRRLLGMAAILEQPFYNRGELTLE